MTLRRDCIPHEQEPGHCSATVWWQDAMNGSEPKGAVYDVLCCCLSSLGLGAMTVAWIVHRALVWQCAELAGAYSIRMREFCGERASADWGHSPCADEEVVVQAWVVKVMAGCCHVACSSSRPWVFHSIICAPA